MASKDVVTDNPYSDDTRDYSENNIVALRDDIADIDSFEAALKLLEDAGITVDTANAETVGDGFTEFDQSDLVNVDCVFLEWQFSRPENERFSTPYAVIRGVTVSGARFRVVDGSQGLCRELIMLTDRRMKNGNKTPNAGLRLPRGLIRSDYLSKQVDDKGNRIPATTYHIAT